MTQPAEENATAGPVERDQLTICFISRALPVHRLGGLEYHLRDLAVALVRMGYVIHIITTCGGAREHLGQDITIHEIPGSKPGDYSIGFLRRAGKTAEKLCAEVGASIVCPVDMAGMFTNGDRITVPVVPIIHGTMTSEVPLDWRYWPHLSWTRKLLALWRYKSRLVLLRRFQRMVERADAVIVDSEFTRRELMFAHSTGNTSWESGMRTSGIAHKTNVVQLGIDPARYPEPKAGEEGPAPEATLFKICLLGRLQEIKGIRQAILASEALRARGVRFRMTIGGSGEFKTAAARLIQELKLDESVRLVGRVEPGNLASFFYDQDVFLFPDLTQPAFGLVAVEAMRYGLPVVAARVGAVPEVVTDNCGWLYDPWDVNELAGLLMELADNRTEVAQKAGCAALRWREFTSEKMADRMDRVVRKFLEKS